MTFPEIFFFRHLFVVFSLREQVKKKKKLRVKSAKMPPEPDDDFSPFTT